MSYQVTYLSKSGEKKFFSVPLANSVTEAMAETMANITDLQLHPNRIISVIYGGNQ